MPTSKNPPQPNPSIFLAVLLIGLLNTLLFTTLCLSSLNASEYYAARHALEEKCLATYFGFENDIPSPPSESLDCPSYLKPSSISLFASSSAIAHPPQANHHHSQISSQNRSMSTISRRFKNEKGEQLRVFMGKEEAWQYVQEKRCRFPCTSVFAEWKGTRGVGSCWGSNGCGVYSCKAPLVEGRVGWRVGWFGWFGEGWI